jgi:DNA-binding NarL/FixJ family response regulator
VSDLRVLIVADDPLARAGLGALLASQPGYVVAGQTASLPAEALADALAVYRPDVLLWDLGWNPAAAMDRLARFRAGDLPIAVLLPGLVATAETQSRGLHSGATQAATAWAAGARVLLPRESGGPALAAALSAAAHGLTVIDPGFTPGLITSTPALAPGGWAQADALVPVEELTPREREVLRSLAKGLSNKAIAHDLGISEHTVKFHVNAILGKLGVESRTEAVVRATRLGLVLL